jgi:hypothetical protein
MIHIAPSGKSSKDFEMFLKNFSIHIHPRVRTHNKSNDKARTTSRFNPMHPLSKNATKYTF